MPDRRDDLREALREHFGHEDFRGDQRAIVERIMGGQSCLAIKPTGGGKSLTYQLPAVLMDGVAVVISPLIALMHDQMRAAAAHGMRISIAPSQGCRLARSICFMSRPKGPRARISPPCWRGCAWRFLPWTRRIACRNGGMISGRIIAA